MESIKNVMNAAVTEAGQSSKRIAGNSFKFAELTYFANQEEVQWPLAK